MLRIIYVWTFYYILVNMALQGGNIKNKQSVSDELSQNSTQVLQVVQPDTVKVISEFQTCLKDIKDQLVRIEQTNASVNKSVSDMKKDLYETDGIDHRLKQVSTFAEENCADIESVKSENYYLRKEVDLLRNVVIRMDRKIQKLEDDVVEIKWRSMRENILIHNFAHFPNEDLSKSVPDAIKTHLGVDGVKFVRIHRNGRSGPGKTVSITGKLADRDKKDEILAAQRQLKANKRGTDVPFYITPQEPNAMVEERKRLYEVSSIYRRNRVMTKVVKNQVILPSGDPLTEKITSISNADVLSITPAEQSDLDDLDTVTTDAYEKNGSQFFASGAKVKSADEVIKVYKKTCAQNDSASSDSRVLVYRFNGDMGDEGGFFDDGQHGVGRRLLKIMRDKNILNTAVVISCWTGKVNIGNERFKYMESLLMQVKNLLDRE